MKTFFPILFIFLPLIANCKNEPQEVQEIRKIYQEAIKNAETTKTKIKADADYIGFEGQELKTRGRWEEKINTAFFFKEIEPDIYKLSLIKKSQTGNPFPSYYYEFLFNEEEELLFAFQKETNYEKDELRCYWSKGELIYQKSTKDSSTEDCQQLKEQATKLKNAAEVLMEN